MIASPSREPRLREGSGDASEIDRESVEWGRGRGRTESAIADKSHRAADNAPLSPSSGAATLKAFQPRHHSYIFLSPLSLPYSLSPASCVSFSPNVPRSFHPFHPSCLPHHHPYCTVPFPSRDPSTTNFLSNSSSLFRVMIEMI